MKMLGDDEVQFQTRVIVIFTFCDKVAINSNLAISMVREVCGFQVNNVLLSTNQPLTLGAIGLPHQLDAPVELSPVNAREFCAANNINVAEETHVAAEELAQTKALAAQLQQMPTALEGGGTIGDLASKLTLLAKADPAKQVSYKIVFP